MVAQSRQGTSPERVAQKQRETEARIQKHPRYAHYQPELRSLIEEAETTGSSFEVISSLTREEVNWLMSSAAHDAIKAKSMRYSNAR